MKKIISCILFMLCITGIVALNAAAAGVSATVNGIPVPAGGGSVTGAGITGSVSFDATTKTLTLENATITVADGKTAINITSGVDTILLKGTNEIKWADESAQSGNLYAVTASALVIKGQSRADSLKITLPGTTATKAYAINLSAASEIKDCSMDITVLGVTGSGGGILGGLSRGQSLGSGLLGSFDLGLEGGVALIRAGLIHHQGIQRIVGPAGGLLQISDDISHLGLLLGVHVFLGGSGLVPFDGLEGLAFLSLDDGLVFVELGFQGRTLAKAQPCGHDQEEEADPDGPVVFLLPQV